MSASRSPEVPAPTSAAAAAEELRRVLEEVYAIKAYVHDGYGLAVVSVWVGLLVWCDGALFRWRAGWDPSGKRAVYASLVNAQRWEVAW